MECASESSAHRTARAADPARTRHLHRRGPNQAEYEFVSHLPNFYAAGATDAQVEALRNVEASLVNEQVFSEVERATIRLAKEMTLGVKVGDETSRASRSCSATPGTWWNWSARSPPTTWFRASWWRLRFIRSSPAPSVSSHLRLFAPGN